MSRAAAHLCQQKYRVDLSKPRSVIAECLACCICQDMRAGILERESAVALSGVTTTAHRKLRLGLVDSLLAGFKTPGRLVEVYRIAILENRRKPHLPARIDQLAEDSHEQFLRESFSLVMEVERYE